jgi:serine phosphatase RsbU (regulator of sigma subunit)
VVYSNLSPGKYTFKLISSNNDGVWNKKEVTFSFEILSPFWYSWWFISIAIFSFFLMIFIYIRLRIRMFKMRQIELEKQVNLRTNEIQLQKEELQSQRDVVYNQKYKLEEIHLRLTDSIDYAKRIQDSILPDTSIISKIFSEHFVIYNPKDKVSGDFYWWTNIGSNTIITVADCTGHGVPGAFMSMLGVSFLREIVEKEKITNPSLILDNLRENIIESLKQKGEIGEQNDGMDISIISIDKDKQTLEYSGANNSIFILKKNKIEFNKRVINCEFKSDSISFYEIKPDKMPIAMYREMKNFNKIKINIEKGDQIYLFSDGYIDQFGGENRKKFRKKPFKELIFANSNKPMRIQKEILIESMNNWQGSSEQIDDITVLGIKI